MSKLERIREVVVKALDDRKLISAGDYHRTLVEVERLLEEPEPGKDGGLVVPPMPEEMVDCGGSCFDKNLAEDELPCLKCTRKAFKGLSGVSDTAKEPEECECRKVTDERGSYSSSLNCPLHKPEFLKEPTEEKHVQAHGYMTVDDSFFPLCKCAGRKECPAYSIRPKPTKKPECTCRKLCDCDFHQREHKGRQRITNPSCPRHGEKK